MAADHEAKEEYEVEVTITDNGGLSAVKTLFVNVEDVNESPIAKADNLETNENQQLIIDPVSSLSGKYHPATTRYSDSKCSRFSGV